MKNKRLAIFDGHCDVLLKLWEENNGDLFFQSSNKLHSSFERLSEGGVKVQTMAVYVPTEVPKELKHYVAFQMIDILHNQLLANDQQIELLTSKEQLEKIQTDHKKLYVLLAIEGADPTYGDLTYLRTFYQLGVRSIGLTWNYRNEVADGVKERGAGGLSEQGFQFIAEMNRLQMAIDISHLAEKGFWDCIEHSKQPIMASHCNARKLHNHPRNLFDEQIRAIFETRGIIGLNFVPYFLTEDKPVTAKHVLQHIEHMLALGGEDYIGLGSDFDGISETVVGLEHSGNMQSFINLCQQHYSETVVKKLFFENWRCYYKRLWEN